MKVNASWELFLQLVRREIASQYKGTALSFIWAVLQPALMLAVYTWVFGDLLGAKRGVGGSTLDFALTVFVGLSVYGVLAECVSASATQIVANASYVKRIVFPLKLLACVTVTKALFNATLGMLVWIIFYALIKGGIKPTILLFPLVVFPLVFLAIGLTWIISSLGVFFRDVAQISQAMLLVMMLTAPIFYTTATIPEAYLDYLLLNPLTPMVETAREIFYYGSLPSWRLIGVSFFIGITSLVTGSWVFSRLRPAFSDYL